jgi:hypothetical protein
VTTALQNVTSAPARTVARALLHRTGQVFLPGSGIARPAPLSEQALAALETDLLDRGALLSADLRAGLSALDDTTLVLVVADLLVDLDELLGAGRHHTPLFRSFPDGIPDNTLNLWVERVLTLLLQMPEQPCVLCGTAGTVHAVSPCAHLVCRTCFDGSVYSACPICHRRIDQHDPFLQPAAPRRRPGARTSPQRLRVLQIGGVGEQALLDAGRAQLQTLLTRPAALSPGDEADLLLLLDGMSRSDLSWLPAELSARTTKAAVLAWLLADSQTWEQTIPAVTSQLGTATDVLRLTVVRSGGAASLIDRPRLKTLPRPLRRALLGALDSLDLSSAVAEMRRQRRAFLALGQLLHAGEHSTRYPNAALMFAALRGTDLLAHPHGHALRDRVISDADMLGNSMLARGIRLDGGQVRVDSFASLVEKTLAAGNRDGALALLSARPGELLRRLNQLLTGASPAQTERIVAALAPAAQRVSPAVLLSCLGQLRTRTERARQRLVFPKAGAAAAHVLPDTRPVLPPALVERVTAALTGEVLRRSSLLPSVDVAVLDRAVDGLVVPFGERTAARQLVTIPRGSVLPLPDGRHLRLFCHWMQTPEQWIDLDLSVQLYTGDWQHVGTCDYTSLRVAGAVHSGDLTSAPAPYGATEFVDLDLDTMADFERYALVSVYCYNGVPFNQMAEAFAGIMLRQDAPQRGEIFDPSAVELRFDLAGTGMTTLPLLLDRHSRTMRWLDVSARVTGTNHAAWRHGRSTGLLASAIDASIRRGERVMLGELGRWIAAARARTVVLRDGDAAAVFPRGDGETVEQFAARLIGGVPDTVVGPDRLAELTGQAGFAVLWRGDVPIADGAQVYALRHGELDPNRVQLLAAPDVPALLAV